MNHVLSPRELEIISLVLVGCSKKEIAKCFQISEDYVKDYLVKISDRCRYVIEKLEQAK